MFRSWRVEVRLRSLRAVDCVAELAAAAIAVELVITYFPATHPLPPGSRLLCVARSAEGGWAKLRSNLRRHRAFTFAQFLFSGYLQSYLDRRHRHEALVDEVRSREASV